MYGNRREHTSKVRVSIATHRAYAPELHALRQPKNAI